MIMKERALQISEVGVVEVDQGEEAEAQQEMGLCLQSMTMEAGIRTGDILGVGVADEAVVLVVVEEEDTITMALWLKLSRTWVGTTAAHQVKAEVVVVGGEGVEGVAVADASMARPRLLQEMLNCSSFEPPKKIAQEFLL